MKSFSFVVGQIFLVCLALGLNANAEVFVRVNENLHRLEGTEQEIGNELREVLEGVGDTSCCFVWAPEPVSVAVNETIELSARGSSFVFNNITLEAAQQMDEMIDISGNDCTIVGLVVDGNGDLHTGGQDKEGVGVLVSGTKNTLISCESRNLPDSPDGKVSSCFEITGSHNFLSCCKAINPGNSCFRIVTKFVHLDHVEGFIDRSTPNGKNRLVGVAGQTVNQQSEIDGHIVISNSLFHADFVDEQLPADRRKVTTNFDPGDSADSGLRRLDIRDCEINLGPSVVNDTAGPFKIVDILESNIENLTLKTHEDFGNSVIFQRTVPHGQDVNVSIRNSNFDQGIKFDLPDTDKDFASFNVSNSTIGSSYLNVTEKALFLRVNRVENFEVTNSQLIFAKHLFSVSDEQNDQNFFVNVDNCDFRSLAAIKGGGGFYSFLFSGLIPSRPSFFNAEAFTYGLHEDALGSLYRSNTPLRRLVATSCADSPGSYCLNPTLGTTTNPNSPTYSNLVYSDFENENAMPHLEGDEGDRIYLHPDAQIEDVKPQGWGNALYWEHKNGRWVAVPK